MSDYVTWYEFKKDLEKEAGHSLLNAEWLRIKPAAPLPWSKHSLGASLIKLERLQKGKERQGQLAGAC